MRRERAAEQEVGEQRARARGSAVPYGLTGQKPSGARQIVSGGKAVPGRRISAILFCPPWAG